jgi:Fe2+ or Zn2+ uptake regulation protein
MGTIYLSDNTYTFICDKCKVMFGYARDTVEKAALFAEKDRGWKADLGISEDSVYCPVCKKQKKAG